ncbi:MAG: hypothetical protein N2747_09480 [Chitinophagaceae bacterium]|nr:hypothetical protein [Chitinophagaceae bacterium]
MIQFFQGVFFIASIILVIMNVIDFNRWQESKKNTSAPPYPIKWFHFILTSLAALGCMLNIVAAWLKK